MINTHPSLLHLYYSMITNKMLMSDTEFMLNDFNAADSFAESNLDRIIEQMPSSLNQEEGTLFDRLRKFKGTPLEKLVQLYAFMDEFYSYVAWFTPCKKGCSHCCCIKVSITPIEAEYIEKSVGIKRSLNLKRKDFFGTPCPFLKENTCLIYKHRPFVCRRHHSLMPDSTWCQINICNQYEVRKFGSTNINISFDMIVTQSGDTQLYDIRQLFNGVI